MKTIWRSNTAGVIMVLCLACQLVASQLVDTRSISGTSSYKNVTASGKTGRAISAANQGSSNGIPTDNITDEEEDGDNSDTNFDNSSAINRHSSEITFPADDLPQPENKTQFIGVKPTVNETSWQKIPLNALVRFGKEVDVSNFLQKYVSNAKVARNIHTLEEILVDNTGAPLLNSRNEKVVVIPAQQIRTITPGYGIQSRVGPGPRSGVHGPDVSIRSRVTQNQNQIQKQRPVTFPECLQEKISVPVPITPEPHLLFIPRCVRVERCGGCCLSDIMACEPDSIDSVDVRVHVLGYIGNDKLEYIDDRLIKVPRHTSCSCKCKTKKEHCLPQHDYDESKCSCVCKNSNEYHNCQNYPLKVWDEENCLCVCREIRQCSSGTEFDLNKCECVPIPEEVLLRAKTYSKKRV